MPIDFPNSPTIGQQYVSGNLTYQWNGTSWRLIRSIAAGATGEDYGKAGLTQDLSPNTIRRYINKLDIRIVVPDSTNDARITARNDIRNFISYYVMLAAMLPYLGEYVSYLWFNSDETISNW